MVGHVCVVHIHSTLGPWINHTITHALQFQGHMTWKNVNTVRIATVVVQVPWDSLSTLMMKFPLKMAQGKSPRTRAQVADEEITEKLRTLIAPDIELWEWAKANYDKQWDATYSFCHARPSYSGPGTGMDSLEYWKEWFGFLWSGTPFHINQPWVDSLEKAAPFIAGWFLLCVLAWIWKRDQSSKAAESRAEVAAMEAATAAGAGSECARQPPRRSPPSREGGGGETKRSPIPTSIGLSLGGRQQPLLPARKKDD
jgi:hypothetical protein